MDALVTDLPNHSSDVTGYVTVVWKQAAMASSAGNAADAVVEIAKQAPSHAAALSAGGAGDPVPMTEPDLVEVAQVAYDPETAIAFDLLRARDQAVELDWAAAGLVPRGAARVSAAAGWSGRDGRDASPSARGRLRQPSPAHAAAQRRFPP
jgi:hypothetical protein